MKAEPSIHPAHWVRELEHLKGYVSRKYGAALLGAEEVAATTPTETVVLLKVRMSIEGEERETYLAYEEGRPREVSIMPPGGVPRLGVVYLHLTKEAEGLPILLPHAPLELYRYGNRMVFIAEGAALRCYFLDRLALFQLPTEEGELERHLRLLERYEGMMRALMGAVRWKWYYPYKGFFEFTEARGWKVIATTTPIAGDERLGAWLRLEDLPTEPLAALYLRTYLSYGFTVYVVARSG